MPENEDSPLPPIVNNPNKGGPDAMPLGKASTAARRDPPDPPVGDVPPKNPAALPVGKKKEQ